MDLSLLIPSRNEEFLRETIASVLDNAVMETEVIAVLDGEWANPPIPDSERVTLVYHPQSIGQRAATNEAARMSSARYLMKLDAHCALAPGFDKELCASCQDDWIMVPRMYNLHAFDWVCRGCGYHRYQGPPSMACEQCGADSWEKQIVFQPRLSRRSDFMRFDSDLRFQYWGSFEGRPEGQGDICDLMCFVGAGWFLPRDWYWEIEGCDEGHGSWGQQGVEMACKGWLSGGRVVVNKRTWFSHMFRTGHGFSFPYEIHASDQERARAYSRELWRRGRWARAAHPLSWLVERFWPVPGWTDEDLAALKEGKGA